MNKFDKFAEFVWKINGICLLIGIIVCFLAIFGGLIFEGVRFFNRSDTTESLVQNKKVSKDQNEKDKIFYGNAFIVQSSPYIVIPIFKGKKNTERDLTSSYKNETSNLINYFFINKLKNEQKKLFKFEVSILDSDIDNRYASNVNSQCLANTIIYKVVTNDSNRDGHLNNKDYSFLFLSNLNGGALRSLTPENKYIDYFKSDCTDNKLIVGLHDNNDNSEIIIYDLKTFKPLEYNLK